jgi:hypothetical protein
MWLWIALAAAVLVRIYLPILRARKGDPVAQALVREFGVKPTGPGGEWLRKDRLWAALSSLVTCGACLAVAMLAFGFVEHRPNSTTTNVFTGVAFLFFFFGVLAAVATLLHLGGALVAPSKIDN